MLNFIFAQTLCCASQRPAAPTPTLVSDVGGNQNVIQVLPVKFKLYKYVMHTWHISGYLNLFILFPVPGSRLARLDPGRPRCDRDCHWLALPMPVTQTRLRLQLECSGTMWWVTAPSNPERYAVPWTNPLDLSLLETRSNELRGPRAAWPGLWLESPPLLYWIHDKKAWALLWMARENCFSFRGATRERPGQRARGFGIVSSPGLGPAAGPRSWLSSVSSVIIIELAKSEL